MPPDHTRRRLIAALGVAAPLGAFGQARTTVTLATATPGGGFPV